MKHGDVVNVDGCTAKVFMECEGSSYPYALEQINGHEGVWTKVEPWEVEPFNSAGVSMCGRFRAVQA